METWQICEKECFEYIKQKFQNDYFIFELDGGSDSSKSDILVTKNGIAFFFIETKMSKAQCGQFVAFPEESKKIFIYSKSNKYTQNLQSSLILEKMSKNFNKYKTPNTKGIKIDIDKSYLYDWVYHFYRDNKNVKYFIVEKSVGNNNLSDDNFIIFPIEHFYKYFDINAIYRTKKSGSSNPTFKDFDDIKYALNTEGFKFKKLYHEDKYVFTEIDAEPIAYKLTGEKNRYQLKPEQNKFKITKLSKTSNPNVIFEITLIGEQNNRDLEKFKSEFID